MRSSDHRGSRAGRTERTIACQNRGVPADRIRRTVTVTGRVQGVFFRDAVRQRALAHGVSGWVRNRSDGAVEGVLEGTPDDVERLVRFFETGPPQATVDCIDVFGEEPEGLSRFEIR
jgi:acylphosphatase